jgi:hypothetical protein
MSNFINEKNDLNATEQCIINALRRLRLFDKVEISYSKTGELRWQITKVDRGTYTWLTDNDTV